MNYKDVPNLVSSLIKEASTIFNRVRIAIKSLPNSRNFNIWFNPKTQVIYFTHPDKDNKDTIEDWMDGLQVKGVSKVQYEERDPPKSSGPWIRIKEASLSSIVKPLASLGGWTSGGTADYLGGPSPLSATIASGALGAGAGYLGGTALEQLFPERFVDKGRLRKTLTMLGGIGGALPGIAAGSSNFSNHGWSGWTKPFGSPPETEVTKVSSDLLIMNNFLDILTEASPMQIRESEKMADAMDSGYFDSYSSSSPGLGGGSSGGQIFLKGIEKDRFNRAVWDDPYLPEVYKGMTSGVLEGASKIESGGDSSAFVSPADIARVGVGMGSGWVSGLIVGKTLGALAGLNPQTQQTLQRAGVFAGLIKSTVPKLFQ